MRKSYETLQKEHELAMIELGTLQKKVASLSGSLLKRALHLTYERAKELKKKSVLFDEGIMYIEEVRPYSYNIRVTGWLINKTKGLRQRSLYLTRPDESVLGGTIIYNDTPLKDLIKTFSATASELIETYEQLARKEIPKDKK